MDKRGNNFLEKSQNEIASLSQAPVDGTWVLAKLRSFLPASHLSYVREFWSQNKDFLDLKLAKNWRIPSYLKYNHQLSRWRSGVHVLADKNDVEWQERQVCCAGVWYSNERSVIILFCLETTLPEAANKWSVDIKHGDVGKIIEIFAMRLPGMNYFREFAYDLGAVLCRFAE